MSEFHKLSSEKYVAEARMEEVKRVRAAMARRSEQSLMLLAFSLIVFGLTMYAVFQMPSWMPAVNDWLENYGVLSGHISP